MSRSRYSIDWISDVPHGWEVKPICRIATADDDTLKDDLNGLDEFYYVDISSVDHIKGITSSTLVQASEAPSRARRLAQKGDVIVSTVRTYLKAIAEVTAEYSDCVYSTGFAILRADRSVIADHYLKWALLNEHLIQAIESHSEGLSYPAINTSELVKLKVLIPPFYEQRKISSYLDRETSRVDTLVAKKTRFLELLREKRQALITHAVTKGLDGSLSMKDSGVEWLGEIPITWDVAPLRVFLQLRRDIVGAESRNTKLLSLTLQGVIERDLDNPTGKMPASFDGYQRISEGEMVFCLFDMDETPRTVGIAPQDGMLTSAYTVFHPKCDLWARYLYYFFLHVDEYKRLRPFYKGLRKTIRPGPFLSIQVPKPPESVVQGVVDYLDHATSKIDVLMTKTEHSIALLREHRTALITAAVTGKIDLNNVA